MAETGSSLPPDPFSTMFFSPPLQHATLLKRYKRFLADVRLPDGKEITIHCPNSGSMTGCDAPGSAVCISQSDNPKRKYPHTFEMVQVNKTWVGINTSLTNSLVEEALRRGYIKELLTFDRLRREIKVSDHSRLDFLLEKEGEKIYIEVKNCTLARGDTALFPDAVTSRGTRHLQELIRLHQQGHQAALLFCVQRNDTSFFRPATDIDPLYAKTLRKAHDTGVKVLAYQAEVSPVAIQITRRLPVIL